MTSICPYIQFYETLVWDYLTDVFAYKLKASELGLTNDLVYRICAHYNGRPALCEVYAYHAPYEKYRGADIDLFIQNDRGTYYWFMLQAKIMDYSGYYRKIEKWKPSAQFLTLITAASVAPARPFYLLFNGLTNGSRKGGASYGLSIIEAEKIRDFRFAQNFSNSNPGIHLFSFDVLSDLTHYPLDILFCDIPRSVLPPEIDGASIYRGYPYIPVNLYSEKRLDDNSKFNDEVVDVEFVESKLLAPNRVIINKNNA